MRRSGIFRGHGWTRYARDLRHVISSRQCYSGTVIAMGGVLGHKRTSATWPKSPFAHAAQDATFAEYRQAVSEANDRAQRLVEVLREQCAAWRMQPVIEALMPLRGIDFVGAVTVVAELGDLKRFAHPRELMSLLGLVPSEYTSGDARHLGKITKTGNGHVRRILIEAAWNYRFAARMSVVLQKRQEGQPKRRSATSPGARNCDLRSGIGDSVRGTCITIRSASQSRASWRDLFGTSASTHRSAT